MPTLANRVRVLTATTGTGTVTLGAAFSNSFCTFAEAGVTDGQTVAYLIEDGLDFEIGTGVYTAAGTTMSRVVVRLSKVGGVAGTSLLNLSGAAQVRIVAVKEDLYFVGGTDVAIADGGTGASTAAAARTALGSTTVGDAVFIAATAAAARTALGSTTVGDAVFIAANAAAGQTALALVPGTNVQAFDADLSAIAALAATAGMLSRTGAGAFAVRTLTAPAAGITINDPTGAAGNPTLVLANDLAALEGLGSTGIAVRSAADTWLQRAVAVTASTGLSVTNGDGVAGNPTLAGLAASTTVIGVAEIATLAEYRVGTDTTRVLGVNETWDAAELVTLTDAAPIAVDFSLGINFGPLNIAASRTLGNPTNEKIGQTGVLLFTATGGPFTITPGTEWRPGVELEASPWSIATTQTLMISYWVQSTTITWITGVLRRTTA